MTTNYHTPIPSSPPQNADAATFNSVYGELDQAVTLGGGGSNATDYYILGNFLDALSDFRGNPTYDVTYTDVIKTVAVYWPDLSEGTYTAVTIDGTWLEPTEWTLTHVASGKTLTSSGLVRNAAGQITTNPTLTIT